MSFFFLFFFLVDADKTKARVQQSFLEEKIFSRIRRPLSIRRFYRVYCLQTSGWKQNPFLELLTTELVVLRSSTALFCHLIRDRFRSVYRFEVVPGLRTISKQTIDVCPYENERFNTGSKLPATFLIARAKRCGSVTEN